MRSKNGEGRHSWSPFIYNRKIHMCYNFLHPERNAVNEVFNPMTHFPHGALPMFTLLSSMRRVRYFTTSLIFAVSLFSKLQMACFYLGSIAETR